MDSGFSYGDIIVIGAIAAFILLRYRAMLGEKSGRDAPDAKPMSEYERVIQLPAAKLVKDTANNEISREQYGALTERFIAMRAIDREFSPEEFLNGARAAFEMVIEAFNKPDREMLKVLLSEDRYREFDKAITESREDGHVPQTVLAAITKAEITKAILKGNTATITVDFLSDQIHLVRDAEGTIIEGNPSQQQQVEDRWVLTRNLTSADPNWKIIET
ncbi:MAG: Tim44/TimA family putative adaptor protein [Rickettsiales bacterium]